MHRAGGLGSRRSGSGALISKSATGLGDGGAGLGDGRVGMMVLSKSSTSVGVAVRVSSAGGEFKSIVMTDFLATD